MKLAIVGSVSLKDNERAYQIIAMVLGKYKPDCVISGGADGIDTMAAEVARLFGIPVKEHLPQRQAWPAYRARNLLIAQECDRLVRIVARDSKTYGSGWTRDRAAQMGKPTEEYVI